MMFVVAPETIRSPAKLNLRRVGGQMLGRGFRVMPRGRGTGRVFWRILFDQAPFRYFLALSPFPIAMLIRPDLALAISQAPLLMFAIVVLIESSVLAISTPAKRKRLIEASEAARGLDILQQRARDVLARIAAQRDLQTERLHLVVEQSGLARVPVLTLLSVQLEPEKPGARPVLLDLDGAERRMVTERMFDDVLSETLLHTINLYENKFVRTIAFEAIAVSAHARLMARARSSQGGSQTEPRSSAVSTGQDQEAEAVSKRSASSP